jgi:hypothetical protein
LIFFLFEVKKIDELQISTPSLGVLVSALWGKEAL